ncbi:MAG: SMP-30/gluconolactonase/LRE family protein [Verrucomicrobiota bacterium]
MTTNIELIVNRRCKTAENPLWHPDEQRLYWLDIPRGRLFRYDPCSNVHELCYEAEEAIGGFTIQSDGALLLFMARGKVCIWRNGQGICNNVIDEIPRERESRFNDVIADPEGRVYCGVMSTPQQAGRLYRLDTDGTLHVIEDAVGTSNGMGFTPDLKGFYHTDTRAHTIYIYDYERSTGKLDNRRPFTSITEEGEARPDGMTVDAEGCLWSALWEGGAVIRLNRNGEEIFRIRLPVSKVSCPTFGGTDYQQLYITTAGGDNREQEGYEAGGLFRFLPNVKGVPEFRSQITIDS